jgi:hypothetical protein
VDHPICFDNPRYDEMHIARVHTLEQTCATAEDDRDQVQARLLHESTIEALPNNVGAADDRDVSGGRSVESRA